MSWLIIINLIIELFWGTRSSSNMDSNGVIQQVPDDLQKQQQLQMAAQQPDAALQMVEQQQQQMVQS